MNALIKACQAELNDNLPYLRQQSEAVSAVARDIGRDFRVGIDWGAVSVAEFIAGSVLFAFVVVPLGLFGKLIKQ